MILALAAGVAYGGVKFTSTWAAPDARTTSFKGQKVATLVISEDLSLRMSGEEALARELTARGMEGVAAYRVIPHEEVRNPDRAKAWFERDAIAGVVTLRPVSHTQGKRQNEFWVSPTYTTFGGYYPYSWGAAFVVGRTTSNTVIVVESLVFKVSTGALVWGGISEATNPKNLQALIADIVKEAAKRIEKRFEEVS